MSLGIFIASYSSKVCLTTMILAVNDGPPQLWHLFLTQAILYGIGSSLYYFPVLALTPAYFDRNRGFALGLILSGAGVGGLVLSPALNALISKFGIGWALRILGIWNFAVGVPVSFVVKKRGSVYASPQGSSRVSMNVVKRGAFIWQVRLVTLTETLVQPIDTCEGIRRIPTSWRQCCTNVLPYDVLRLRSLVLTKDRCFIASSEQRSQ